MQKCQEVANKYNAAIDSVGFNPIQISWVESQRINCCTTQMYRGNRTIVKLKKCHQGLFLGLGTRLLGHWIRNQKVSGSIPTAGYVWKILTSFAFHTALSQPISHLS